MYVYGVEPAAGARLALLLAIVLVLLFSFNILARKWFKVEKKKLFSYNHVNEKHKKIDWLIRLSSMASILVGYAINITRDPSDWYWFLQPWFILTFYIVISQAATAVMERKYAQNPNAYKVTISELIFALILFLTLYQTDFWGLG
jgi:divalent metal cation (Fe/Co/Zn/Cd) transporter